MVAMTARQCYKPTVRPAAGQLTGEILKDPVCESGCHGPGPGLDGMLGTSRRAEKSVRFAHLRESGLRLCVQQQRMAGQTGEARAAQGIACGLDRCEVSLARWQRN